MMKKTIPPERLNEIERRILKAQAPADFVPDLAKEWKRSTRMVWTYVARVRARLAARAKAQDPEADREMIRQMLLHAYSVAERGNDRGPDTRGMVAAAKVLGDLTGASAPVKVDVTSGGAPFQIYLPHEDGEPPQR